eukprot:770-Heterococcus_DN1.PRE.3
MMNSTGAAALYGHTTSNITMKDSLVTRNSDLNSVCIAGNASFYNTSFIANAAIQRGSTLACSQGIQLIKVDKCLFTDNLTADTGGALSSQNMMLSNSVFMRNFAAAGAGAIAIYRGNTTAINCTFIKNKSSYGGAITVAAPAVLRMSDSFFQANQGLEGGERGGACASKGTLVVTDSAFIKHATTMTGGAIDCSETSTASIATSRFTANTATSGAAIYTSGALSINSSSFADHTASVSGT